MFLNCALVAVRQFFRQVQRIGVEGIQNGRRIFQRAIVLEANYLPRLADDLVFADRTGFFCAMDGAVPGEILSC